MSARQIDEWTSTARPPAPPRPDADEAEAEDAPMLKTFEGRGSSTTRDLTAKQYRARTALLRTLACAVATLVVVGKAGGVLVARGQDLRSARDAKTKDACGPVDGSSTLVECRYDGSSFLAVDAVRDYFERNGVGERAALTTYVPQSYVVTYDPDLVRHRSGKVAFALYLPMNNKMYEVSPHDQLYNDDINLNGTYATFLVVAAWDGAILAARPVTDLDGRGMTRFDAVKLADPDTVLACSNVGATEEGYVYAWKWRSDDAPARLNDLLSASSHDVQLAVDGAYYWQPQYVSVAKRRVDTGETVAVYDVCPDPGGMNHAQLVDDDARALVSCRYDDSVVLYDLSKRETIWRAGGADATLAIVDARGDPEAWSGQHNAELFGDAVYLFDNAIRCDDCDDAEAADCDASCVGVPSRILRFRVDGSDAVVDWVWEIPLDYPYGYSKIFGDADLLPSGNVLASWWAGALKPSIGATADVTFVEVTPAKEVAWSMAFANSGDTVGGPCTIDADLGCERSQTRGWKAYSVERFYDGPLVYDAALKDGALQFTAHAALKLQRASAGTWTLLDDDGAELSSGGFSFAKQHLATRARLGAPAASAHSLGATTVRVADEWGQSTDARLQESGVS